jgi:hypothetical protein
VSDCQIEAIEVLRAAGAFVRLDEFGNAIGLEWGRHARITEAGLKLMATLQSLTWVDLTGMTDAWLRYVAQLLNLRRLYFGTFGSVTDAGMTHLVGLTRLQYLGLEHTDITLVGLKHLSNLTQLTTLTVPDSIGLEYVLLFPNLEYVCNYGAKDADLGFLVGLSRLKVLGIESAAITDAGLEHLAKLTALAELYLFGTRITEDGFARLRKALPNCQIDDGLAGRGSCPESAWQRVRLASRRSE